MLTCQQIADVFDVNFNTVKKYLIKIICMNEDRNYIDKLVFVGG